MDSFLFANGKVYRKPIPLRADKTLALENAEVVVVGANGVVRPLADPSHRKVGDRDATPEEVIRSGGAENVVLVEGYVKAEAAKAEVAESEKPKKPAK